MQTATNAIQMCPIWPCIVRVWDVTELISHVMNTHEKSLKKNGMAKILSDWGDMEVF